MFLGGAAGLKEDTVSHEASETKAALFSFYKHKLKEKIIKALNAITQQAH